MAKRNDKRRERARMWMRQWRAAHPDKKRERWRKDSAAYRKRKKERPHGKDES